MSIRKLLDGEWEATVNPPAPREKIVARLRNFDKMNRESVNDLDAVLAGHLVRRTFTSDTKSKKFSLHACFLDSECREYAGWVWRVNVHLFSRTFSVALRPSDRFVHLEGSEFKTSFFDLHRDASITCNNVVSVELLELDGEKFLNSYAACPFKRDHKGPCFNWVNDEKVFSPHVVSRPYRGERGQIAEEEA